MFLTYLPVLMMLAVVGAMGAAAVIFSSFLRPNNPYGTKLSPWECGMEPIGDASTGHFRVHFFVIAILFIVFDVETLYLFPWAVLLTDESISLLIFIEMFVFIVVLAIGLIYAWGKGALDWVK
ncbi:MAG: NADH-quinone oxidoreductase subunit A [Deltaproteobacteria bacterium]|nr:NADH-quinone oxidoreductase subunit A [Deltaproteobacteria bacterium]